MDETNDLSISLGLDPTDLRNGLNEAERAIDGASRRISSSLENIGNLGQRIAGLGATLTASITVPLLGLATASVKAYGDIQALQKGLESISGSASVANREFEKLKEVAKLPGIGLQEAVKGSINLQAIGLSAGTARKVLLEFGNAVASVGKGRVEFERAIYGITQLANTPFPLGEDLNIIADALPQVRTLLQDAFGKTRSDDLAKMGVTSKQILDVILKGLGELPRVSGGIKNSFENLKDSLQQNLARVGKILDDNLDISGIINKVTEKIDLLISKFENLSPGVQKTILVVAALAAAIGPLLLAIGGIMTVIPILVNGFQALRTAILAVNTAMLANPYTALAVGLGLIATALATYYLTLETARDRQNRFNDALTKATIEARKEQVELAELYKKTQDQSIAIEERRKAVDLLQKQYPGYFGDLKDEIILAGKASQTYQQLSVDIYKASRARAAQAELDKRSADRLEKELELRNKLRDAYLVLRKNTPEAVIEFNRNNPFDGIDARDGIKEGVNKYVKKVSDELLVAFKSAYSEDAQLKKVIESGLSAITKLDANGVDKLIEGTPKIKKEVQKQLAEIYPIGSIAELRQRAGLLLKAIETSNNDIIKIRGLDKYGKETNKLGLPIYTGEILSREKAVERLADLNMLIGEELKPVNINSRGLLDQFGQEYSSFNDFMLGQVQRTGDILGTQLPTSIDNATLKTIEAKDKMVTALKELNESLNNVITSNLTNGISDAFASIGQSLANGNNVFKALGQTLLGSFGKILGELGKQLIQYGVGLLAIKVAMKSLNPYVAIAAGAALVALGAGVTASVAKQSESIGGGNVSTSTGSTANPNFSSNYTSGGNSGNNEFVFRISGTDLVSAINRNVSSESRLNSN